MCINYFHAEDTCIWKLRIYFYLCVFVTYVYNVGNVINNIQEYQHKTTYDQVPKILKRIS